MGARAVRLGRLPHVFAVPGDRAACGLQKPSKDAQQTRFSRAIGATQDQRTAGQEFKREGAENRPFSPDTCQLARFESGAAAVHQFPAVARRAVHA